MRIAVKHKNLMKTDKATEIGETIEAMVKRMTTTNEPIDGSAPIIFTPRKDGVINQYNIRADKWDEAMKNMEQVARNRQEKRAEWQEKLDGIQTTQTEE